MCRVGGMVTAALAIASCQVTGGGREVALQRTMIAGDEPVAVRTARSVLDEGGNAVDAAVAAGFALAVTLPSRAGLGGGGACLVHDAEAETVRGIVFTPSTGDGAALPGLARGLFAVHALGGRLRWERLVRPAEMLARFGVGVPRALAADISAAEAAGRLPDAFRGPDGAPLAEGATMVRPELAQSLSMIRSSGAGAIHRGPLATAYAAGATAAGVPIDPAALGDAVAATFEPAARDAGNDRLYVATPEAAAGPLQGRRLDALAGVGAGDGARLAALARAALDAPADPAPGTAFAIHSGSSGAVVCGFGMGALFGTGVEAGDTGILVGSASPTGRPLVAGLAMQVNHPTGRPALLVAASDAASAMTAPVAAAQAADAPAEVAAAAPRADARQPGRLLVETDAPPADLPGAAVERVPALGLANVIHCRREPGSPGSGPANCAAAADPRGAGLAVSRVLIN